MSGWREFSRKRLPRPRPGGWPRWLQRRVQSRSRRKNARWNNQISVIPPLQSWYRRFEEPFGPSWGLPPRMSDQKPGGLKKPCNYEWFGGFHPPKTPWPTFEKVGSKLLQESNLFIWLVNFTFKKVYCLFFKCSYKYLASCCCTIWWYNPFYIFGWGTNR